MLPLRSSIVFPREIAQLILARDDSGMLDSLTEGQHRIVVVGQRDRNADNPSFAQLYSIGTESAVLRFGQLPLGVGRFVMVEGIRRVRLVEALTDAKFLRARVEPLEEVLPPAGDAEFEVLTRSVRDLFSAVVLESPYLSNELVGVVAQIADPTLLSDFVAAHLSWLPLTIRQEMLEALDLRTRFRRLTEILGKEHESLELEGEIEKKVHERFIGAQRQAFLREQMKTIQRELGEGDLEARALADLQEKLARLTLSDQARAETERELRRLSTLPADSSEAAVVRTWLELVAALPVGKADGADSRRAPRTADPGRRFTMT